MANFISAIILLLTAYLTLTGYAQTSQVSNVTTTTAVPPANTTTAAPHTTTAIPSTTTKAPNWPKFKVGIFFAGMAVGIGLAVIVVILYQCYHARRSGTIPYRNI